MAGVVSTRIEVDLDVTADLRGWGGSPVLDAEGRVTRFGYLPDPRRLWAWGIVFGGSFFDLEEPAFSF